MILATGRSDGVAQSIVTVDGLNFFLQVALRVLDLITSSESLGEGTVDFTNDRRGRLNSRIEIDSSDECFEGIF